MARHGGSYGRTDLLWKDLFRNPSLWNDNRHSKCNPRSPDFRHSITKEALWMEGWFNPCWVLNELSRTGMVSVGQPPVCKPKSSSFVELLKACAKSKDLYEGTRLHSEVLKHGPLVNSPYVACTLIHMYAKCGALAKAQQVLEELCVRDVVCWNALISGYTQQGQGYEAIHCFERMQREGLSPDEVTFTCLFNACGLTGNIDKGIRIHDEILPTGLLESNTILGNALLDMYAKCGMFAKAWGVLKQLPTRNIVTWNALISGYVQHEQSHEALKCMVHMQDEGFSPNEITFTCGLKACGCIGDLDKGKEMHEEIVSRGLLKENILLGSALVDMYAKCSLLTKAQEVLDELPVRNVVCWNAIIAGYAQHQEGHKALNCFARMQREGLSPDEITLTCILKACGNIRAIDKGNQIHDEIENNGLLRKSIVLGNALVDMYAKSGMLARARQVLDQLPVRDIVSWNTLVAGYAQNEQGHEALDCFACMQREGLTADDITFACILKACGSMKAIDKGKFIHGEIVSRGLLGTNIVLGNSLVDMYAKCSSLSNAQRVLEDLPMRNVVTWNTLIAGYTQHDQGHEALNCFGQMQRDGLPANEVTLTCILKACGSIGATGKGLQIHFAIINWGFLKKSIVLGTALVDMYAKCGLLAKAQQVLEGLYIRDVVSWSALIAGYAQDGQVCKALDCFQRMRREGLCPDDVTFVSVLNACSHSGNLDVAQSYYEDMSRNYGITPILEHHTCMVVIFGCAGRFDKAMSVLKTMPSSEDTSVWLALLGACRKWGNVKLGKLAFDEITHLDNSLSTAYVVMANIYAAAGMHEDAENVEKMRIENVAWKKNTWVDAMKNLNSSSVGDANAWKIKKHV